MTEEIATPVDLTSFIDKMAEVRYLTYDSHASMPNGMTWAEYKADDPSSAEALYLEEVHREVLRALPTLTAAFRSAGWVHVSAETAWRLAGGEVS